IRLLSHQMGLPTWNKPALACLASRFPYGITITPQKLNRVEQAETFLHKLGFKQVRVRHHDHIARIEVSQEDIGRVSSLDYRDKIIKKLKELNYQYITLDLQGFRSGSMNEVLSLTNKTRNL
ncbi:TIGR00268 family protein, partial [bacterium]|nr:TIGR00268 family protein [bacterium]